MNVYTAIPQEYSFFIEDAERDAKYPNRYKFKFPDNWRTSSNREPMIGIRAIFIPKAYRHVEFDFIIEKYLKDESGNIGTDPTEELTFHIESFIPYEHDLRELRKDIFDCYKNKIEEKKLEDKFKLNNLYFCYEYRKYPRTNRYSYCQVFNIINKDDKYVYKFGMYNMNDDAKAIFNYYKTEVSTGESPLVFYDVWDRHDNMITSSLTSLNSRQYLGFTDDSFKPIKYFKLNNNTNEFWIELWNSRNREIMSVLPYDDKDGLIIEAVLLESGKEMR